MNALVIVFEICLLVLSLSNLCITEISVCGFCLHFDVNFLLCKCGMLALELPCIANK